MEATATLLSAGLVTEAAQRLTKTEAFLAGGLARGVAAAATCPVTVVKTRMEYAGGTAVYKVPSPANSSSTSGCTAPWLNTVHCATIDSNAVGPPISLLQAY